MKTEYFVDLEYRPGYVAEGWIQYENNLEWYGDIYDYDYSCYSVDGCFKCPMSATDQAILIVAALNNSECREVNEV